MAFDGTLVNAIVYDLKEKVLNGKVNKVAIPEKDEVVLTVRNNRTNYKVCISILANMPKVNITTKSKVNPLKASGFLMLLRKQLVGALITDIVQPDFERIIEFHFRNLDELGETIERKLIVEMMGRHSNIIFVDEKGEIIDAIKRIGLNVSSVREVFPKRDYVKPRSDKLNPMETTKDEFLSIDFNDVTNIDFIKNNFNGISFDSASEICFLAGVMADDKLEKKGLEVLYNGFSRYFDRLRDGDFCYSIFAFGTKKIISATKLGFLGEEPIVVFDDVGELIENYYEQREISSRINQKSSDLKKFINTNLERCYKKLGIQENIIKDSADREKLKVYGELLFANIYSIKKGDKSVTLLNYNDDNKEVTIRLDENLSPAENANKYLAKYNKKKRALKASKEQLELTKKEIAYLESVKYSIENALMEEELVDIRRELVDSGYAKKRGGKGKKALGKSKPHHFVTEDGFHIYVGKNNVQNEMLITDIGKRDDMWFHVKTATGSHVLLVNDGRDFPDEVYEIAAGVAAYFSTAKDSTKVEIDYTLLKNIKRPNGSMPGYVIYYTNYSMTIKPSIDRVKVWEEKNK